MAKRRKRRSAARNAKGHFVKRSRRRNPRRAVGKKRRAAGYTIGKGPIRRRKLNPTSRRHSRRRHRNPSVLGVLSPSNILGQLVPAAYGAGGAIVLNVGLSYLPLPDFLKTGWARHGVRLVGAMLVGWGARKFLGERGRAVGFGALTVVVYDILKGLIATASPEIGARLGDFEDVSLADEGFIDPASPVSAYLTGDPDDNDGVDGVNGMGAYLRGDLDGNLDGVGDYNYV